MADKPHTNYESGLQPPRLTIDWELYGTYLDNSDLSDAQKHEVIQTLWDIAMAFVDLGFGTHAVQHGCEQKTDNGILVPDDLLSSVMDNTHNHNQQSPCDASSIRGLKEES